MPVGRPRVALKSVTRAGSRRGVAAGKARSVSAWVEDAIAAKAGKDELLELLDEMKEEHGPPSEEAYAWARMVLGHDEP